MMRTLPFLLLLVASSAFAQFDQCRQFFADHKPVALQSGELALCKEDHATVYDPVRRLPRLTAHVVTPDSVAICQRTARQGEAAEFYEDTAIPLGRRARLDDYKRSGLDRGHLAPFGDSCIPTANGRMASNVLSNTAPQSSVLNRGQWLEIAERPTRKYVTRTGESAFVLTGLVFGTPQRTIGNRNLEVPSHFWKLVQTTSGKSWAYWAENTDEAQVEYISKEQLEKRLGYKL